MASLRNKLISISQYTQCRSVTSIANILRPSIRSSRSPLFQAPRLTCTPFVGPRTHSRSIQFQAPEHPSDRIYILGTGSVGKFVAHTLRGNPKPPPVTLLFHRPTLLDEFNAATRTINLKHTSGAVEGRGGFDAELALPERRQFSATHAVGIDRSRFERRMADDPIHNLIVSVKAQQTVNALKSIRHRLTPESTILFLQNGMGIVEEVSEKIFTDPKTRPNYMVGINSHGLHATGTCSVVHAGHGVMSLGVLPRLPLSEQDPGVRESVLFNPTSLYLLRALTRTPLFAAVALPPTELLEAQLEKLVVNCVINPLTVMLDCRNGDVLANFSMTRVMRLLMAEILLVIQSLPELQGSPNLKIRFSPERMEKIIVHIARQTSQNISSMLQDVRRGTTTEIEYINGYIVDRGEKLGIKPVMNYMLMHMVQGKQNLISKEIDNYTPFAR